jgi:hypothetical protein
MEPEGKMRQLSIQGVKAFSTATWNEAHPYHAFRQAQLGLRAWIARNPVDLLHCHSEFADNVTWKVGPVRYKGEPCIAAVLRINKRGQERGSPCFRYRKLCKKRVKGLIIKNSLHGQAQRILEELVY